jgi:hypothetical protein
VSRRGWLAAALTALAVVAGGALAQPDSRASGQPTVASGVATQSRLFRLQHRSIDEAVALVRPLLSEDGAILMEPRRRAITVHDRPERLARVQEFLSGWDLPPRNVRLTLQLIRARAVEGGAVRLSQELRGLGEALKDVTRWTDYETAGSRSVTISEGGSATLDIDDFRVSVVIDPAPALDVVRLRRFALERREPAAGGGERLRPIWDTVMNLKTDQLTVLGATRLEQSDKAILITVTASVER